MTDATTHAAVSHRPRVLMITHRFVHPPDRGDRIRTWHTLVELARHCDVSLASLADEPVRASSWRAVYDRVEQLAIVPAPFGGSAVGLARALASGRSATEQTFYSPDLHRTLRQWAHDRPFDAVLSVCSSTARYLHGLDAGRCVVDLIDADSRKWADFAEHARGPRRWVYQREARKLAEVERALPCDHIAVTSPREARLIEALQPDPAVTVVRNGVALPQNPTSAARTPPLVLFTGVLDYKPNVDGLDWFIRHVWPAVRQQRTEARFQIVGRNPNARVRKLAATDGVELVGPVPDVQPYFQNARLAVAPLPIARGVQNKALQAMAAARPVVCSDAVHAGVAIDGRSPCIRPANPDQWQQTLVTLLEKPTRAASLGNAARRFAQRHYDWRQTLRPLISLLLPHTHNHAHTPAIHTHATSPATRAAA